jgi:hypothetical protein
MQLVYFPSFTVYIVDCDGQSLNKKKLFAYTRHTRSGALHRRARFSKMVAMTATIPNDPKNVNMLPKIKRPSACDLARGYRSVLADKPVRHPSLLFLLVLRWPPFGPSKTPDREHHHPSAEDCKRKRPEKPNGFVFGRVVFRHAPHHTTFVFSTSERHVAQNAPKGVTTNSRAPRPGGRSVHGSRSLDR